MRAIYQRRRDQVMDALARIGLSARPSAGTIYVWARIPDGYTSAEYAGSVLDKAGVIVPPAARTAQMRGLHPYLTGNAR